MHLSLSTGGLVKAPSKIWSNATDILFISSYLSEKISLDITCESSAWQTIRMKCQELFSLKNNTKDISKYRHFKVKRSSNAHGDPKGKENINIRRDVYGQHTALNSSNIVSINIFSKEWSLCSKQRDENKKFSLFFFLSADKYEQADVTAAIVFPLWRCIPRLLSF